MPEKELQLFVIEDNIGDFLLIQEALTKYGIEARLHLCQDGEAALKQLAQFGPANLPDLMIMDLNVPRIDGMQLLRYMRGAKLFDRTPVMVFTSSESVEDRLEAERSGANAYVTKPSNLDNFLLTVASTISKLIASSRSPGNGGQQRRQRCAKSSRGRLRVSQGLPNPLNDRTDPHRRRILY